MGIVGAVKEGAGFVQEEIGEKLKDQEMMQDGRALRNEGKLEQGKAPKLTEPGTGHKDEA